VKPANGAGFVHLHAHTCFSLMRGVPFPEELVLAARARGYRRLAVTDTDGLYGLLWFLEAARAHGIAPIIGVELTAGDRRARAVLLARNWEGYRALCRLITARHLDPDFRLAAALAGTNGDLFILSDSEPLLRRLAGRENVFAELLPGRPNHRLTKLARELGLKTVATAAAHYTDPGQFDLHRLLRAIDRNTTLANLDPRRLAPPSWTLAPEAEMRRLFSQAPEAVDRAAEIAAQCQSEWSFSQVLFPAFDGCDAEQSFALLREKCLTGIKLRYGGATPEISERLAHELDVIHRKRFSDVFLIVADIVARTTLTCGRGSAAASLVSYLLGITHVDPIRHDLYFERFLSPNRQDPPDIDVDFAWDERDGILAYIFERYGGHRAAMIANHVCFRARASLREIAKVHGLPDGEIGAVTRRLRSLWYWHRGSLEDLLNNHPMFRDAPLDQPWPAIIRLAQQLEGRPRNLSVHCGGVVVTPGRIDDHAPCQLAAKGVPIVQWEKDQAEDAGLVKIDILGNRSLAVIRDALAAVNAQYGLDLRYESLNPLDDPATIDLLARGDSIGVFYVESPAMRQLQQKTGKGDYEHLVIHSSLIRPAANKFTSEYIARLHGKPYQPLHPVLGELLRQTHGVMVYQEDVSRTAVTLAGLDPADAEGLRKILTRKSKRRLGEYERMFREGALARGVSRPVVNAVWDMILSFGGYSFCKPHSASYALVSFKSAWLKVHYPAEFMAAVISNQGGYYATFAYVSEARRMGLRVLPPDINASEDRYHGRDDWIRIGLMQIAHLGQDCIDALIAERRRGGPFTSCDDFLDRVRPDPSDARILIKAGCLDAVEPTATRPELIWRLLCRQAQAGRAWGGALPGQTLDLFAGAGAGRAAAGGTGACGTATVAAPPPRPPQYDEKTILRHEVEALGFLASRHPLDLYARELAAIPHVAGRNLAAFVGERVTMIGWYVTGNTVVTRQKEPMEFVSFEDTTAIYEAVFFPRAYRRFCQMLTRCRPYVIEGKVEESFGVATINVAEVRLL